MKKTLLLGTALAVGVAGFAQNAKQVNPKIEKKISRKSLTKSDNGVITRTAPSSYKWPRNPKTNRTAAGGPAIHVTSSYNAFGVGGGLNTYVQNCLSYNADLNKMIWTQRASYDWAVTNNISGHYQATIIDPTTPSTVDSIIVWKGDASHGGRYPGGTFLNPASNTDWHNAFGCAAGYVTAGSGWVGTAYTAKPFWSKSAANHNATMTADSLYDLGNTPTGVFGNITCNASFCTSPNSDMMQAGNTVWSAGGFGDASITDGGSNPTMGIVLAQAKINSSNSHQVDWSNTQLTPPVRVATAGYIESVDGGRVAFGPDGMHGYAVTLGRLDCNYGNKSADSSLTPIVYKTTDGGATWTEVLAGYDWATNHPEVQKNVNMSVGYAGYISDEYYDFWDDHGLGVVVDANNVLHLVTSVREAGNHWNNIDSIAMYSYAYHYDYINYHPIIWDFMTDGTSWKTMMVDSILSAGVSSSSDDTTSTYSAWTDGSGGNLGYGAHLTVSRSTDGSTIFYGWGDSNPDITGVAWNTNPDVLVKGFDVTTNMLTPTMNITNEVGTCYWPYISDITPGSLASGYTVAAVYTTGRVATSVAGQSDGSQTVDYWYVDAAVTAADFTVTATINNETVGAPSSCPSMNVASHNNFSSSISNFPNPFNSTTNISVTLSENKAIDVKVYDAIGNLIFSKKTNGNAGVNNIAFDGGSLSAGVYYYTVTAGNEQATKKMVIAK